MQTSVMAKGSHITVELLGGAPWGFRLGGGAEFGCPLEIAKIRKKSKADLAGLAEGDVITLIDHQDVSVKSHEDAMKIMEQAGDKLVLNVIKGTGPSASMGLPTVNSSQGQADQITSTRSVRKNVTTGPVEAIVVRSREPSINRSFTERSPSPDPAIPRALTVISQRKPKPQTALSVNTTDPWRVDITSYELKLNASEPPQPVRTLRPPVSPKPKFKAGASNQAINQGSCPVIVPWGAPPENPCLHHISQPLEQDLQLSYNSQAYARTSTPSTTVPYAPHAPVAPVKPLEKPGLTNQPVAFKVPKAVNASAQTWKPTITILKDQSRSQPERPDPSPQPRMPLAPSPASIPVPPPLYQELLAPRRTGHIPGMVNPLIYDDTHGDFEANPAVRPSKKIYSDSAFYDAPGTSYPTIHEQVALCKQIANFLESGQNNRSRGGRMFHKRKQRAEEWSLASQGQRYERPPTSAFYDAADSSLPSLNMVHREFGYSQVRHHPDPIKSHLTSADLEQIQHHKEGICHHDELPPNIAFDINSALTHSHGKAGQIFAKRRERAEKYTIDENNVRHLEHHNLLEVQVNHDERGAKPFRTPWEAAMAGNVDLAFSSPQAPDSGAINRKPAITVHPQGQRSARQNPRAQPANLEIKTKQFRPIQMVKADGPPMHNAGRPHSSTLPRPRTKLEELIESRYNEPVGISKTLWSMDNSNNSDLMTQSLDESFLSSYTSEQHKKPSQPLSATSTGFMSLKRPKDYMKNSVLVQPQLYSAGSSHSAYTNTRLPAQAPVSAF